MSYQVRYTIGRAGTTTGVGETTTGSGGGVTTTGAGETTTGGGGGGGGGGGYNVDPTKPPTNPGQKWFPPRPHIE